MLKSVCELAQHPLHEDEDNFSNELVHFILTWVEASKRALKFIVQIFLLSAHHSIKPLTLKQKQEKNNFTRKLRKLESLAATANFTTDQNAKFLLYTKFQSLFIQTRTKFEHNKECFFSVLLNSNEIGYCQTRAQKIEVYSGHYNPWSVGDKHLIK